MEGRINNINTTNLVFGVTKSTIPDAYLHYQVEELVKALAQLPTKDHIYPAKAPLENYLRRPPLSCQSPAGVWRHRSMLGDPR